MAVNCKTFHGVAVADPREEPGGGGGGGCAPLLFVAKMRPEGPPSLSEGLDPPLGRVMMGLYFV